MGQQFKTLNTTHKKFIAAQKLFFVATATDTSKINLSPKGMDSLVVLDSNRVAWLNVTGSGNETAAHVQTHPRMTIMFCAFDGAPMILRLYGKARAIHKGEAEWQSFAEHFDPLPGARQIFELSVEMVQTSCGMSVPLYDYQGDRDALNEWAEAKGESGIQQYWQDRNEVSLDGIPTHIVSKTTS